MVINLIKLAKLAKIAVVVPAAASSVWLVKDGFSAERWQHFNTTDPINYEDPNLNTKNSQDQLEAEVDAPKNLEPEKESVSRKRELRIQKILVALNKIAEVSAQMNPDRSEALEPVIVDLAEQAMMLSQKDVIQKASTERDLAKLEKTVRRLTSAVANSIEPEMSL